MKENVVGIFWFLKQIISKLFDNISYATISHFLWERYTLKKGCYITNTCTIYLKYNVLLM